MSQTTPMMAQYLDIKERYSDYMLFYRMGDFYELFFEDAINAASVLDIALTKRGQLNGKDIPMAGVPVHSHEAYLLKLIEKGFYVAVCEQTETPEQAKARGAKGPLKRDVVRLITPATLTEDSLLKPKKSNFLMALSPVEKSMLGCVWIDFSTGDCFGEIISIENLYSTLNKIYPSEILLPESLWKSLPEQVFEIFKSKIKPIADARFNLKSTEKSFLAAYHVAGKEIFGIKDNCLIQAFGIAIEYLNLTQKHEINFLKPPKISSSKNYLKVDAQTFNNLEIVKTLKGSFEDSLLHNLDNTKTSMGGRLFHQIITTPLFNAKKIESRQNRFSFFYENETLSEKITSILKGMPDLERALIRIALKRAFPRDLKAVQICLYKAMEIEKILCEQNFWQIPKVYELLNTLDSTLMETLPATALEGKMIKSGVNQELDEIIYARDHGQEQIKLLENKYSQETGITNLKIRANNLVGYYIEVTLSNKNKIPDYFKHKQAISNGARYITDELIELAEKLTNAAAAVIKIEYKIFQNLCDLIINNKKELENISSILAELDMCSAFAIHAKKHNYCLPTISDDLNLNIIAGRHPIVELYTKETFTPNNCDLNHNFFALLTGPNMAGKSTYLRQNALIIWMAHCGLFVPAGKAEIGLVDQIFCRIGAADDLAAGRSTFMVEMIETASILHQASEKSFIILDEIGRGTSTQDGLAIAQSVSEYLIENVKARCIFVTHYHELVELAKQHNINLLTVKIIEQNEQVIFMHEIINGSADKSYGIHVAELAGLPKQVVLRAKELVENVASVTMSEKVSLIQQNMAEQPIMNALKSLKLDELTPKQALNILYELKEKLNGKAVNKNFKPQHNKQSALF